jgi:hypothetical protein
MATLEERAETIRRQRRALGESPAVTEDRIKRAVDEALEAAERRSREDPLSKVERLSEDAAFKRYVANAAPPETAEQRARREHVRDTIDRIKA